MVRDDAVRLKRCLDSARAAVDEVVVLDTGSKDDSVQVARDAGARIMEIEWPGSFGAGFNVLLDQIQTDWILRLDSDEWFDLDPTKQLRDATADPNYYGYKVHMRDLLPAGGYREFSIFRLWRSHPKMRYEGRVHENIPNDAIMEAYPGLKLGELPLWIWHDGYVEGTDKKRLRNLELVEEELAKNPCQPYYVAMRALMRKDMEDPGALKLLQDFVDEAVQCDVPSTRMLASAFIALLGDTPDEEMTSDRVSRVIERAWEWFCTYPGVLWAIGQAELRRKNPPGALKAYLQLEKLAASGQFDRSIPFNANILGLNLWHALGFVAQQAGRFDVAERCARKLMSAS